LRMRYGPVLGTTFQRLPKVLTVSTSDSPTEFGDGGAADASLNEPSRGVRALVKFTEGPSRLTTRELSDRYIQGGAECQSGCCTSGCRMSQLPPACQSSRR